MAVTCDILVTSRSSTNWDAACVIERKCDTLDVSKQQQCVQCRGWSFEECVFLGISSRTTVRREALSESPKTSAFKFPASVAQRTTP